MASSLHTPLKKSQLFSTPSKPTKNPNCPVRVIVRVRPFLPSDVASKNGNNPSSCISLLDSSTSGEEVSVYLKDQETSRSECYRLDAFFDQEDDNVTKIFENEVKPLIPGIFHGYNSTVFAYGASGSGKTYTFQRSADRPGLIHLSMSSIFEMCQSFRSSVKISYYEIYLEKCFDLLEPKAKEVSVLDDKDGKTHVKGLSQVEVNSMAEFYDVFSCAIRRRKVAHTDLNDASSRSHGVLVISVSTPHVDRTCDFVTGKLNLIDLAGNEDMRRTCNEGIRLQESTKINQSLFALSNVIYALNNNKLRVPYRESKLTRILQDSLGGKNHALMVACLNPGEYQESVNTVSLAARSRHISISASSASAKNTPTIKVDMEAKLQAWLESKGKTKSSQKRVHFASPLIYKTPRTPNFLDKMNVIHSSAEPKNFHGASSVRKCTPHVAKRNLFCTPHVATKKLFHPAPEGDTYEEAEDLKTNQTEVLEFLADLTALELDQTAILDESVLCVNDSENGKPEWFNTDELASCDQIVNELSSPLRKVLSPISSNISTEDTPVTGQVCPVTPLAQYSPNSAEKLQTVLCTPTVNEVSSSLRNVLSPISSNISTEDTPVTGQVCPVTPLTQYSPNSAEKLQTGLCTPLDKFHSRSSNLKNVLIQEYIEFLNDANREELLKIRGIGPKIAEYIMELRQTSPLKSLSDLGKLGLSSRQVFNMFGKAARDVLG